MISQNRPQPTSDPSEHGNNEIHRETISIYIEYAFVFGVVWRHCVAKPGQVF